MLITETAKSCDFFDRRFLLMKRINFWISLLLIFGVLSLIIGCAGQPRDTYTAPGKSKGVFSHGGQSRETGDSEGLYAPKRRVPASDEIERMPDSWYADYGNTQLNIQEGIRYLQVGLYEQAQKEFEKAIDYDPYFGQAYVGLGRVYLAKNLLYNAESSLLQAIKLSPEDPNCFYYLAVTYCRLMESEDDPHQKQEYQRKAAHHADNTLFLDPKYKDSASVLDGDCAKLSKDDRPSVLIKTEPSTADVYLGQTYVDQSPVTVKMDLKNAHDITAEKMGYFMRERQINLEDASHPVITIILQEEQLDIVRPFPTTTFHLSDTVLFDLDKAELKSEAENVLNEVGIFLEQHRDKPINISGHTCDLGSTEYNQKLSERRARAVAEYLIKNFNVPEENMTIIGNGESQPLVANTNELNRSKNRRTMIEVMNGE